MLSFYFTLSLQALPIQDPHHHHHYPPPPHPSMVKWHGAEQGTIPIGLFTALLSVYLLLSGDVLEAVSVLCAGVISVLQSTSVAYAVSTEREAGWFMWWVAVPDRLESAHLAGYLCCIISAAVHLNSGLGVREHSALLCFWVMALFRIFDRVTSGACSEQNAVIEVILFAVGCASAVFSALISHDGVEGGVLEPLLSSMICCGICIFFQIRYAYYDVSGLRIAAFLGAFLFAELHLIHESDVKTLQRWSFLVWASVILPIGFAATRLSCSTLFSEGYDIVSKYEKMYDENFAPEERTTDNFPALMRGAKNSEESKGLSLRTQRGIYIGVAGLTYCNWYGIVYAWGGDPFAEVGSTQGLLYIGCTALSLFKADVLKALSALLAATLVACDPYNVDVFFLCGALCACEVYQRILPDENENDAKNSKKNAPKEGPTKDRRAPTFSDYEKKVAEGDEKPNSKTPKSGLRGPVRTAKAKMEALKRRVEVAECDDNNKHDKHVDFDGSEEIKITKEVEETKTAPPAPPTSFETTSIMPFRVRVFSTVLPPLVVMWTAKGSGGVLGSAVFGACLLRMVNCVDGLGLVKVGRRLVGVPNEVFYASLAVLSVLWSVWCVDTALVALCFILTLFLCRLSLQDNLSYVTAHDTSASHQYHPHQLCPLSHVFFFEALVLLLAA